MIRSHYVIAPPFSKSDFVELCVKNVLYVYGVCDLDDDGDDEKKTINV